MASMDARQGDEQGKGERLWRTSRGSVDQDGARVGFAAELVALEVADVAGSVLVAPRGPEGIFSFTEPFGLSRPQKSRFVARMRVLLVYSRLSANRDPFLFSEFYLLISILVKWSRGDSNPWSPPCKVRLSASLACVVVQKRLPNDRSHEQQRTTAKRLR